GAASRFLWFHYTPAQVAAWYNAQPTVDDLLDDLGELVMHTGGQVVIVPSDAMPTRSGLAAIYRF
ncbi:MAG: hypothetical protein ACREN3_15690, partial [Gemmatimonadaceae bacterium]